MLCAIIYGTKKECDMYLSMICNLITEEIIMFKKFLSLTLVLMMIMSFAVMAVSAAEADVADVAAEADVAEQGAEADVAATGALDTSKCINFDISASGWNNPGHVGFYIYDITGGGGELIPWGSKKLFKSEETSTNVWSFDPEAQGIELDSSQQYFIIFINENTTEQTCNLVMDSTCIGDTAYCTGNKLENDVDSGKSNLETAWKQSSLGPMKVVTSIGNVIGTTIPKNTNAYDMFVKFLKDTLANARTYIVDTGKKTEQQLIDDTAAALGIGKSDCEKAIKESGADTTWKAADSTLKDDSDTTTTQNNNTTTTTTTKTGSGTTTKTGQETTVLFIMLAVMVAAAGVIFVARKREQA